MKKPSKFKNEENFVRLNMKKKYEEKFRNGVGALRRNYTKNGKLKRNFKKEF